MFTRRSMVPAVFALAFALLPHAALATNRTVTSTADSGAGTLRDALTASANGDSIDFAVTGTVGITGFSPVINVNVTINGPGAQVLAISRINPTQGNVLAINTGGTVTISGLAVTGASGNTSGSAIVNLGTLTLNDCELRNNSSGGASSGHGAGLSNTGQATLSNCTFTLNTAESGGLGGAIYNQSGATLFATNCTFDRNFADASNSKGGAVYTAGEATFFFCTFGDNIAVRGSAIYHDGGVLTLRNTLLGVRVGENLFNNAGTFNSFGYNLADDNGAGLLTQPTDLVNADPKLDGSGLHLNGGTQTRSLALLNGSAAIDKGKTFGLTTDQRGFARPIDNPGVPSAVGGDAADIGAYESAADPLAANGLLLVTTLADHDDGTCGVSDCTLREAIARANDVLAGLSSSRDINFAAGVLGTISLQSGLGELGVNVSISLIGPGARLLAVSGGNAHRVFNFSGGVSTVSGLMIRDGTYTFGSLGASVSGGAILNAATLTLNDCTLTENTVTGKNGLYFQANNGGAGRGGAIFNDGTLTVNRCAFSRTTNGNRAIGGVGASAPTGDGVFRTGGDGGAGLGGAIFNDTGAHLTVNASTFSGSAGTGGAGGNGTGNGGAGGEGVGAIYNQGTMMLTGVTLSANAGNGGAGGLRGQAPFTNGASGVGRGGVRAAGGTSTVRGSLIAANTRTPSGSTDVDGTFVSGGYNLIGIGDFSTGFTQTGDQVGTTAAPINPILGPLQNNGGPTDTMALLAGSPAIDQGQAFGLTTDERGLGRTRDLSTTTNATGGDGTDIGAFELSAGVLVSSILSRKTHGTSGTFDLAIPTTGATGVECRSGGAGLNHQLIITFAGPVSVGSLTLASSDNQATSSYSVAGSVVTLNLGAVANAQKLGITLNGVTVGATQGSVAISLGLLLGDTTRNGSVTASDVGLVKSSSGQAVSAANFASDVTVNGGSINSSDIGAVKAQSGNQLPAIPGAPAERLRGSE